MRDAFVELERSLITPGARFDQWLAGDKSALTPVELEGWRRFKALGCVSCHQGINLGCNLTQKIGVMHDFFGLQGRAPTESDMGLFAMTNEEADRHVFRVASLRNVALTAPYFHDGSAATLEDAVRTMGEVQLGGRSTTTTSVHLVAFLKTLTGRLPAPAPGGASREPAPQRGALPGRPRRPFLAFYTTRRIDVTSTTATRTRSATSWPWRHARGERHRLAFRPRDALRPARADRRRARAHARGARDPPDTWTGSRARAPPRDRPAASLEAESRARALQGVERHFPELAPLLSPWRPRTPWPPRSPATPQRRRAAPSTPSSSSRSSGVRARREGLRDLDALAARLRVALPARAPSQPAEHGRVILAEKPKVDAAVRDILALPGEGRRESWPRATNARTRREARRVGRQTRSSRSSSASWSLGAATHRTHEAHGARARGDVRRAPTGARRGARGDGAPRLLRDDGDHELRTPLHVIHHPGAARGARRALPRGEEATHFGASTATCAR